MEAGFCSLPVKVKRRRLPATAALDQPHDDQQNNRTDGGGDDRPQNATAEPQAQHWKEPARNQGADDTNDNIADEAEACALYNLTGKPAGCKTDQQDNKE